MSIISFDRNQTDPEDKTDIQEQLALHRYMERMPAREKILKKLQSKTPFEVDSPKRVELRKAMIDRRDEYSLERVIGQSDLFPINYLEKGLVVGKSVCRIETINGNGHLPGYGTGFLVSPFLVLTNNHVIPDSETALHSSAQFNYEQDLNFNEREMQKYNFKPERFFMTNMELDFTLVAVSEKSASGTDIRNFGYLPLIKQAGKILLGEYVSIIQHPEGRYKSVVLRENKVTDILDNFIHYTADTCPGSSGAVVCNDDWQVIALHHSGVKDPEHQGEYIANEGIRISSILQYIGQNISSLNTEEKKLIQTISCDIMDDTDSKTVESDTVESDTAVFLAADSNIVNAASINTDRVKTYAVNPGSEEIADEFGLERYVNLTGHDIQFLGKGYEIPHPKLRDDLEKDAAETITGDKILNYTHFSIVVSKSRCMAFYTVVDIDGTRLVENEERVKWRYDPRIDQKYQTGEELYKQNKLDKGHLVRRKDPMWGNAFKEAMEDSFHYTNCSPQYETFNQNKELWLGLEDYLLDNVKNSTHKAIIFTGPVFREEDMVYRNVMIPDEYWKIAVVVKDDGDISATAYIVSQKELLKSLEQEIPGEFGTFQVKISVVEALTGLNFWELRNHDPLEGTDSETFGKKIVQFEEILL